MFLSSSKVLFSSDVDMEKSNLEDFTDILDAESLMAEDFTRHLNDEFQVRKL